MALVKDENTYITLEEAEAYFARRSDVAAWTEASEEEKERALLNATLMFETLQWIGYVNNPSQPLSWPRSGIFFDPRLGYATNLPTDTPQRIQFGQAEMAYHILNNDGILDDTGKVVDIGVGAINLTEIFQPSVFPLNVKRIIQPLINGGFARPWWRAN